MANFPELKLEYDFEHLVTLRCLNIKCKFNMANRAYKPQVFCNLKYIETGRSGECLMKEEKQDADN